MTYTVNPNESNSIQIGETDPVKSKLQEIAALLSTRQGSIPMFRRYGLPQRFLDMPVNRGVPVMIAEVAEAMAEFIPDVTLIKVEAKIVGNAPGTLNPVVKVEIHND